MNGERNEWQRMLMQILLLCFKARSALRLCICIWWLLLEVRRGIRWSLNRELCKSPLARTLVLNRLLIISMHIHFVVHFCCVGARIHVREGERNNYSSTVAILEMLHICTVRTMATNRAWLELKVWLVQLRSSVFNFIHFN